MQIAEQYTPDCGGGFGEKLRAGKVNGLARSIDELRVRDLEQIAKELCWACRGGEPMKIMSDGVTVFHESNSGTWNCDAQEVGEVIAALKSTMGDEGRTA